MIFALAFIQIFGSILNKFLGSRNGTILTGFFGGLISSTATTMSIARKSKIKGSPETTIEMLIFLSSTGAMLLEGVLITFTGISNFHFSALLIFIGPLISSSAILYFYSRKLKNKSTPSNDIEFNVLPILKLSLFIIFILFVSKLLQKFFGQSGLIILTFIISLFEIHGSVIANIQLYENGIISIKF